MTVRLIPLDPPEIRLLNYDRADWIEFYLAADDNPSLFGIDPSTAILFYVASDVGKRGVLDSLGYPPETTGATLVAELRVGDLSYKIRNSPGISQIFAFIREDNP